MDLPQPLSDCPYVPDDVRAWSFGPPDSCVAPAIARLSVAIGPWNPPLRDVVLSRRALHIDGASRLKHDGALRDALAHSAGDPEDQARLMVWIALRSFDDSCVWIHGPLPLVTALLSRNGRPNNADWSTLLNDPEVSALQEALQFARPNAPGPGDNLMRALIAVGRAGVRHTRDNPDAISAHHRDLWAETATAVAIALGDRLDPTTADGILLLLDNGRFGHELTRAAAPFVRPLVDRIALTGAAPIDESDPAVSRPVRKM